MKKLLLCATLLCSFTSFAASVKITSFNYVRTSNDAYRAPLAELCGRVEGATSEMTFVKVSVDPRSNRPGSYNTVAGSDGKFCLAVITYTGLAEASALGSTAVSVIE